MAQKWYYRKNGNQHGPVTSAELKQRAVSGELGPDDQVRPDNLENWVKASAVKGLFAAQTSVSEKSPPGSNVQTTGSPRTQPTTAKQPQANSDLVSPWEDNRTTTQPQQINNQNVANQKFFYHPAFVAASFLCCFPATLALIWTHPVWQTATKWMLTGAIAVFIVFAGIMGTIQHKQDTGQLQQANALWDAGKKDEACVAYETLTRSSLGLDEKRPIYERLITFHYDGKRVSKAKELYADASGRGISPAIRDDIKQAVAPPPEQPKAPTLEPETVADKAKPSGTQMLYAKTGIFSKIQVEIPPGIAESIEFSNFNVCFPGGAEVLLLYKSPAHAFDIFDLYAHSYDKDNVKLGDQRLGFDVTSISVGQKVKARVLYGEEATRIVITQWRSN